MFGDNYLVRFVLPRIQVISAIYTKLETFASMKFIQLFECTDNENVILIGILLIAALIAIAGILSGAVAATLLGVALLFMITSMRSVFSVYFLK